MKRAGLFALLLALPVFAYANGWNSGIGDLCKGDEGAFVTVGGYVLPCSDGEDGQVLATDGSGIVSWATGGGGGNVTGSVVKVDGTALSTANFVDGTDITVTATGSNVGMALASAVSSNIGLGVTAYGWGNHGNAGYLTDAPIDGTQYARKDGNWTTVSVVSVETDPIFNSSASSGIASGNISNWNTAYSWGNHGNAGYLTADQTVSQSITNGLLMYDSAHPSFTEQHALVDKEYVDSAVAIIGASFFMLDAADATVATYKLTSALASDSATATVSASVNATADTLIEEWISPAGYVWTTLAQGVYDLNIFAERPARR